LLFEKIFVPFKLFISRSFTGDGFLTTFGGNDLMVFSVWVLPVLGFLLNFLFRVKTKQRGETRGGKFEAFFNFGKQKNGLFLGGGRGNTGSNIHK